MSSATEVQVRRLGPADWQTYRDVRLYALASDPAAFSSTLDAELLFDEDRWRARLGGSAVFMAAVGGDAIGLVGGIKADEDGAAELVSMWVAPAWRGTEVALKMITAVAEWTAQSGFERLTLWVVEGNRRAERAYAKAGFARTGREQPVRTGEPALEFQMERRR